MTDFKKKFLGRYTFIWGIGNPEWENSKLHVHIEEYIMLRQNSSFPLAIMFFKVWKYNLFLFII